MFEYVGSGGARTGGCGEFSVEHYYEYKFLIGSRAWLRAAAVRGRMRAVIVKQVTMIRPYEFLYKDTQNSLHNEWDLLGHEEALAAAMRYNQSLIDSADPRAC